jgi:DNA-binding MarR family transcriptional regulator
MINLLTFDIHKVVWQMDAMADHMLMERFGITFSKFHVLVVLESIQPTTQAELALCVGHSTAAISKSLATLKAENLVTISSDPHHGRKNIVQLTPAGTELVQKASSFLEKEFVHMLRESGIDVEAYTASTSAIKQTLTKGGY